MFCCHRYPTHQQWFASIVILLTLNIWHRREQRSYYQICVNTVLKDADIRKAMDIFHKDYADITPYQIQRFVHVITQDNANQRISLKYPSKFDESAEWLSNGAGNPQPTTHDILNLGQIVQQFTHHSSQIAIANQNLIQYLAQYLAKHLTK